MGNMLYYIPHTYLSTAAVHLQLLLLSYILEQSRLPKDGQIYALAGLPTYVVMYVHRKDSRKGEMGRNNGAIGAGGDEEKEVCM